MAIESPVRVSNLHIMRALLAKDWRLFRVPTIALVLVAVGCYLLGGAAALHEHLENAGHDSLFAGTVFAAVFTALVASAFGGAAIAGERSDRTADFIALLPVTRRQIILSKWLVSGFVLGTWAAAHVAVAIALMASPNCAISMTARSR